ncbi:TPA: phage tail spike protein [Staphylococcus pseudintermedius]
MIHVLNFNSQIIDFISRDDNAVTIAKYHKTKDNDLLDIRILSQRAEHFKKRNRIIIQDKNGVYREYIIDRAEEDGRYVDVECTASHLVDISTSKPIPPGKYEKMTINQKLSETLRDSGWVVGDCDYAGLKTNSWTSVRTPLEMISQLETAHEVQADYEIEIDGYEVVERRVNMKIPAPLFKGKEIEYGKDLLSMKRVIDFSEVKTALFALGPEPEQGKRVETFVYDDEAQKQFDLPYRYIWGVYEPETEDDNMSLQRLTTLAKTELNKRKSAAVSYEISVVDIEKEFPHEVIRYGDIVRIKNPDFTPTLYAESEVIGIEHDLISNKCTYEFGKVVEYQEDDLLRYFRNRLGYFNQKFNDKFSNVNTIVRESIEGELQYFERKILKGDTPPENPINDLLWLDTSNTKVPVLRRYFNGKWIKSSAENASDVGAITREQAMYSGLSNTFVNLTIQHSRLMHEVSDVLESEYLIDTDIKEEVNNKLNDTIGVFNTIKSNLDSMTSETATIGKLVDTQALFLEYREKLQALYNTVENAKIAIDERFKLLQSQYTDEKFNEALNNVASKLGLTVNEDNQLVGEVDVSKQINKAVREMTKEMLRDYVTSTEYQSDKNGIIKRLDTSDSERKQLSNQIADRVTRSEYENDVEQRLVNSKAEVLIEAEQTSNRVSKEVFNENSKTLERYTSEFINNVSTGMSFNYDDNGNIQSANVGRDGIKLKGDRVDITVNKDFNVLVNDVSNKADETNIVNKLNLSREGLDINVNNIGIRGGNDVSYVDIRNDQIELSGEYTRTFRGDTQKDFVYTRIKDGLLRFRNNTRNRSLYYSDFGISTYVDGGPNESSGTLQFFDYTYSKNARGVTLNSVTGVVALRSDNNSIVIESSLTTNIESNNYSVYIRPFKQSRAGLNEFQFYVKDADSSSNTDGCILFGNLTDPNGVHGSGIRFSKSRTDNILYVTNPNGDIGTGDISVRAAEIRDYIRTIGMLEIRQWSDSKAFNQIKVGAVNTTNSVVMASHSGGNAYYGVGGGSNEMRVTDNNGYNGGNTRYKSVRADTFYGKTASNSSEKYKTNIKKWIVDASKLLKDTVFYEYNYKSDLEKGSKQKSHGIIIEREMPGFISRDGDSIDLYEFISTVGKALQEQMERNDQLEFKLENIYRILEEYADGENQKDR